MSLHNSMTACTWVQYQICSLRREKGQRRGRGEESQKEKREKRREGKGYGRTPEIQDRDAIDHVHQ